MNLHKQSLDLCSSDILPGGNILKTNCLDILNNVYLTFVNRKIPKIFISRSSNSNLLHGT